MRARADIVNGLAAGKEVTVHQSPITQSGWTGSGYIITDLATGSGAYKISGGANGSFIKHLRESSVVWASAIGAAEESVLKMVPMFALIEQGILDGLSKYITDAKSCLLDSQRSGLLQALAAFDQFGKWYMPLPDITSSVALTMGYSVILSYTVHFTMLNAVLGDCPVTIP